MYQHSDIYPSSNFEGVPLDTLQYYVPNDNLFPTPLASRSQRTLNSAPDHLFVPLWLQPPPPIPDTLTRHIASTSLFNTVTKWVKNSVHGGSKQTIERRSGSTGMGDIKPITGLASTKSQISKMGSQAWYASNAVRSLTAQEPPSFQYIVTGSLWLVSLCSSRCRRSIRFVVCHWSIGGKPVVHFGRVRSVSVIGVEA